VVTLATARERHLTAKKELEAGRNPAALKQAAKSARRIVEQTAVLTFEKVAEEYFKTRQGVYSEKSNKEIWGRLVKNIFPALGAKPIDDVSAPELLDVLVKIKASGREVTAARCRQYCGQVFKYAMRQGWTRMNPAGALENIPELKRTTPQQHQRAVKTPAELGRLLAAIETYDEGIVGAALRMLPHVFLRVSELAKGEWAEIDFADSLWRIPALRMKAKQDHLVPLSSRVKTMLEKLHELTGDGMFIFPAYKGVRAPMNPESLRRGLERLGYGKSALNGGASPHGFRQNASTFLREMGFAPHLVELQMAHAERNAIVAAYNFAEYLPERRKMMEAWSEFLDELKAKAEAKNRGE
jgi:integrase